MSRFLALAFLSAASVLILLFCFSSHPWAEIGFAVLSVAFPCGLMALGASRRGRLGSMAVPIFTLLVLLEAALVGMLVFRGQVEQGAWFLGLPAAAAIQIYGVFLAPLVLVVLGYALTFDRFAVEPEELERLREIAEMVKTDGASNERRD